jgi:glycosyltransferase involved in cell wall biosynthesis
MLVPSIAHGSAIETPTVRLLAERLAQIVDLHVYAVHFPTGEQPVQDSVFTLHPAVAAADRFSRRLARTILTIRREHQRAPFDIIHALWLHEPGTIAVAAGSLLRLPVVASIGGAEIVALRDVGYGALRTAQGRLMTAHVLQRSSFVTGGSDYVLRRARRLVPHRDHARFRRIPLPVDAEQFVVPELQRQAGETAHVLHAASLIPVKDQPTLLYAFRRVVDVVPHARLTIAGEDPFGLRSTLERQRDTLGLSAAVTFPGPLPHAEMATLYHAADLFVLSSRHESQGMVVLEAAASGVPTVGTAVGVVPDLAPDAAIAVRPGDSVALADAIIALLTDPVRRARMGEQARQRVVDQYDAPVVRDSFVRLYDEAIDQLRR